MNFYKKNPEIKGNPCIQGTVMEDDTVVYGDKFKKFADKNTFPGVEPMLIKVSYYDLTDAQKAKLKQFEKLFKEPPPRHLGAITTANFTNTDEGAKLKENKPSIQDSVVSPDDDQKEEEPSDDDDKEETIEDKVKKDEEEPVKILEVFNEGEFCDDFAGITKKNVKSVLENFDTFAALADANNSEMRKTGVRSNFFDQIRVRAQEVLEELDEEEE